MLAVERRANVAVVRRSPGASAGGARRHGYGAAVSRSVIIGATAFIWIFIKLPQEWWIHIAQLDLTDFVQEKIFGVEPGTA